MKYVIVSVRDNAIGAYMNVTAVRAKGEALRNFIDAINNPENKQLHHHPSDFDLYHVAYFDDEKGEITSVHPPEKMANGFDVQTQ